jgi:T5SS/PEP-CTERM-associated repeat protein/autotransporter-associated beta strand protein
VFEVSGGSVSIYTNYIATYQSGEIRVNNGGLYVARNNMDIGRNTGSGTMTVTGVGSEFRTTGGHDLALGRTGTGAVIVSDGAKLSSTYGNRRLLFAEGATGKGSLSVGGASGAAAAGAGTVNFARIATGGGDGQIIFNHTEDIYYFTQDATATGANILIEGRTKIRVENGVTRLKGTNTYTGGTTVVGGTLLIADAGTGSVLGTGAVTVGAGGTLGGVGNVNGATMVAGTLSPGYSPGTMTFQNGLTLESTARLVMEIDGTVRGVDYDAINVNGTLALGGELYVVYLDGFTPEVGDTFDLFNGNFTASSQFSKITFASPGQGTFDAATGVLTVTSLVPEPSSLSLMLVAGLLAGRRVRRRKA